MMMVVTFAEDQAWPFTAMEDNNKDLELKDAMSASQFSIDEAEEKPNPRFFPLEGEFSHGSLADDDDIINIPRLEDLLSGDDDDNAEEENAQEAEIQIDGFNGISENEDSRLLVECRFARRDLFTQRKPVTANVLNGKREKIGFVKGELLRRRYSVETDPKLEETFQICEEFLDADQAVVNVLCITKCVMDCKISMDMMVHLLRGMLKQLAARRKFDVLIVDVDTLTSDSYVADNDYHQLLQTAEIWTTWQYVGLRSVIGSKSKRLLASRESLLGMTEQIPLQPFMPATTALCTIESKHGAATLTECVQSLCKLAGVRENPTLLLRSNFVMDEWGYIGRVMKDKKLPIALPSGDLATVINWGHNWTLEAFKYDDVKQGRTRGLIPCEFEMPSTKKRGRSSVQSYLDKLNVKVWKRGNGW